MYDYLIQNGFIADGSGGPVEKGDLAIKDGRIEAIEKHISPGLAQKVMDAENMIVAPGFIDIHSHSDVNFLSDDRCESKLYQGVTTELMGQCGSSVYPAPDEHYDRIEAFAGSKAMGYASFSLADFAEKIASDKKKMSTNLLPLVGHGALRCGVMGYENRPAGKSELDAMHFLLARDMADGAWGLSLGLGYTPGVSSDVNELASLGEIVAAHDGIVTSHMRNQGTHTPESLNEMYEIFRRSGAHVHIAHFKASGKAAWGRAQEFIDHVHKAQHSGIHVTADVYPYTAASSGITNSFPKWSIQGGKTHALDILAGPERYKIISYLEQKYASPEDGKRLVVVSAGEALPEANGKNMFELSELWGISQAEAVARVAEKSRAGATCISFSMTEPDVDIMLSQMDFAIGSDGRALPFDPLMNAGKPHPRNFGTFPRFLKFARENNICEAGQAVRRLTGLSADIIGLKNRGYLRPGYVADITIFNWDKVADRATYSDPFQKPEGIEAVFTGGCLALWKGTQTAVRNGSLLLKP